MKPLLTVLFCLLIFAESAAQLKEPYKPLHGGKYDRVSVKESPDSLITYRWNNPKATDSLQIYTLKPKKVTASPNRSFAQSKGQITVVGKGSLLIDFGVESAGWLEFDADDLADSVEVSISEYNEPAILNAGAQTPVKTKVPVKYGNTYRLELNDGLYEGVRFAWIHVKSFSKTWHIKNLRLVCQVRPTNYEGSFSCNDPELTRIWYTGAYVVKLNLLQDYFGAILMERSDRHSWTGDAYPAQAAALAAFGNYDVVKKNIAYTSAQNNGIAAYSLYWVLSLIDYFNYTADTAFFKEYAANADKRLEKAYHEYDQLPKLNFMGWDERLGAGFENPQTKEAQHTYRMLCINAWKQFAKAASAVNETGLVKKYEQFAASKIQLIKAGEQSVQAFGIHAVSEAVNAGLANYAPIGKLSASLFSDRLNRLSYSPFNQYFIIQAMASAKQYDAALTTIKDLWGGQLNYGGTTFFEVYRPSWNAVLAPNDAPPNNQCGYTSLAHPWSAGVTKWLSENILGVKPLTPGFKTFTIIPNLGHKLTEVNGSMPTPSGVIKVAFNTGSGNCGFSIPQGTIAERIALPKAGKQIGKITVNGELFWDRSVHPVNDINTLTEDSRFLYLRNVKPGKYVLKITYTGIGNLPERPLEKFNYQISGFTPDSLTSGNWIGKYGRDGVLLLGYPKNNNSQKLPVYVDSVTLQKNDVVVWDSLSKDSRVLVASSTVTKTAAAIITKDPDPTFQTMTVDIKLKKDHPYKLSMYFLDFDHQNRRSAIEIFDLETLNILAPVAMVRHYEKGKYLGFSFNKSVRIRINHVRGKNAALSGIFFDQP
ncbi:MAG: alpha-L-rhamnosidase C-terminal domain-containing protein [Sphingobacteriaceae bacterium]